MNELSLYERLFVVGLLPGRVQPRSPATSSPFRAITARTTSTGRSGVLHGHLTPTTAKRYGFELTFLPWGSIQHRQRATATNGRSTTLAHPLRRQRHRIQRLPLLRKLNRSSPFTATRRGKLTWFNEGVARHDAAGRLVAAGCRIRSRRHRSVLAARKPPAIHGETESA